MVMGHKWIGLDADAASWRLCFGSDDWTFDLELVSILFGVGDSCPLARRKNDEASPTFLGSGASLGGTDG